jgi:predicted nuclease of restriction endonuclease-like (RecB) superfamily
VISESLLKRCKKAIMSNQPTNSEFHIQIIDLLQLAKKTVVRAVNSTMVQVYFEIGKMIIEEEQGGNDRAKYGKNLLQGLSKALTKEFGKGFSVTNIQQMRNFYLAYRKQQTASVKLQNTSITPSLEENQNLELTKIRDIDNPNFDLSWSHYLTLVRIENRLERQFYEIEATKNQWSVKELKRQYNSALYTRLVLSLDKEKVKELSQQGLIIEKPKDAIKDPYILEFLGLPEENNYSESELEQELIDKLEHFLLELGTGFTFVARQKRISFDDKHFRIDLVFYNRLLRCFVLLDLKIGELKHQDIGQMQMYVNYYDRKIKMDDENKTIGLILCQNKSEAVVKYTLPKNNEQIFASKYKTVLPTQEELKLLIKQKK